MSEGLTWLKQAVDASDSATPSIDRARALFGVGGLAIAHGDFAWASSAIDESVAVFAESGEKRWLARARVMQETIKSQQGQEADVETLREDISLLHEVGDRWWQAFALQCLGDILARSGDCAAADACYQEGLAIYQDLQDPWGAGSIRFALGSLAAGMGDYRLAHEHFQQTVALLSEAQDHYGRAGALAALADAAGHLGDYERAATLWRDSLRRWQDMGNEMYGPVGLAGIASSLQRQGRSEDAARLFGTVAHQMTEMQPELAGAVEWAYADMCHESLSTALAVARSAAQSSACDQAWKEGEKASLEEAIALALREDSAERKTRSSF